jgi:hypothetical protein
MGRQTTLRLSCALTGVGWNGVLAPVFLEQDERLCGRKRPERRAGRGRLQ